jgi:hypothetical protein
LSDLQQFRAAIEKRIADDIDFFKAPSDNDLAHGNRERDAVKAAGAGSGIGRPNAHQSPSGWRFTTRIRLRIMNRPAGFFSIAAANAARAGLSVRQMGPAFLRPTRGCQVLGAKRSYFARSEPFQF